jgi:non-heme chloroperoxidase
MEVTLRRFLTITAMLLLGSCTAPAGRQPMPLRAAAVPIAGEPLSLVEAGRGEALIMIHGGFQDYRMWLPFVPVLSRSHRVLAYSRRNHHPNRADPNGTPDFAADEHAEDLLKLVTALRLGPVHLVGHSSGASTALFFAAHHPELVRSLVIVEPPVASLLTSAPQDQQAAKVFMAELGKALGALRKRDDLSAVRLFAEAVGGPGAYERRTPGQKAMMLDNLAAHIADATTRRQRPNFTCATAQRIRAPVLLVSGTRSPPFFQRIAERLSDCLPNERRAAIAASHSVPGENPPAFQQEVLNFLQQQQGDSS